jgi:nitric oxide dioxygenase
MTEHDIALIRAAFPKVAAIAEPAAGLFYQRLFEIDPSARALFGRTDMTEQGRKLMSAIGFIVASLNRLNELVPAAKAMPLRHVGYGVTRAHYDSVGEALIWTLGQGLGEDLTPELAEAWGRAYALLSGVMTTEAYPQGA